MTTIIFDRTAKGVALTGILGGGTHGGTCYKSPAVEAKNTFSYIVMQGKRGEGRGGEEKEEERDGRGE